MAKRTMQLLLEEGILETGDVLGIDRTRFRKSRKVTDSAIRARRDDENFWRCQVTEKTMETEEIKYLKNDRYYRATALVNRIAEDLTDEDYAPSEIGYWTHPRYGGANLWELRTRV